ALNFIPPRQPGTGTYEESLRVLMALTTIFGPTEAISIAETWSPPMKGWNPARKIQGFRVGEVTAGTLFWIAQQHGFKFPEKQWHSERRSPLEPDPIAYQEYVERQQQEEEIDEAIANEEKVYRFKDWLNKGFKKLAKKEAKKLSKDNPFGVGENYQGNRAKNLMKAIGEGFNVLDNSLMGDGKSRSVLEIANPNGNLIYLSKNHRNPSIKKIEDDFTDIHPRSQWGFYRDGSGKLKEGNREIDEKRLIIQPNCIRGDIFKSYKNKGYDVEDNGDEVNPICGNCPLLGECSKTPGLYKYEKQKSISAKKQRGHIDSYPRDKVDESDIFIIDEPTEQLTPTKKIDTEWEQLLIELDRFRGELSEEDYSILDGLGQKLKYLFDNKDKLKLGKDETRDAKRYGLKHQDISNYFSPFIEKSRENLERILEKLELIQYEYIVDLFGKLDREGILSISDFEHEKEYQSLKRKLNKEGLSTRDRKALYSDFEKLESEREKAKSRFKIANSINNSFKNTEYIKEVSQKLESTPPNGLINILKGLLGDNSVALRIRNKEITITIWDKDKYAHFSKAKLIFLDSTADPDYLEKIIPSDRPLKTIHRGIEKPLENLDLTVINTPGLKTNNPTDTAIDRTRLILREITTDYGDTPLISHKNGVGDRLDIDGYFFVDNIGSNQFDSCPNLAYLGTPSPNLGALQDHYQALYGSLDGFDNYYQREVKRQILQGVGRQRCQRYPDQQFSLFWLSTDLNLEFLKAYGCKISNHHSLEYHPEAGDPTQVARLETLSAIAELRQKGAKITLQAIGDLRDVSREAVRKLIQKSGLTLAKLIRFMQKILSTGSIDTLIEGVDRKFEVKQLRQFLELEFEAIATETLADIKSMGWEVFEKTYLQTFPEPVLARITAVLMALIDENNFLLNPSPPE
ncbi:MAG: hypothetical protein MK111_25630, partial [Crocosphaera sp.]|uniref:hypothetical protein n=1 Tax=Crocosphaera sp. TaxID=2729996 RepID=UPI002590DE12